MEFSCNAREWERMTPAQRARRCRTLAGEAESLANCETAQLSALYTGLAIQWKLIAEEIERKSKPEIGTISKSI